MSLCKINNLNVHAYMHGANNLMHDVHRGTYGGGKKIFNTDMAHDSSFIIQWCSRNSLSRTSALGVDGGAIASSLKS